MQGRLDALARGEQSEEEFERLHYADRLAARRETEERERQRKAAQRASARAAMLQAHTPAAREEAYRQALHTDPNISQLQILDMSHPMAVAHVYVRLRLHQETKPHYDLEPALLTAETRGDPNALLRARIYSLETRTQAAMTPEEALQKYARCVVLGDPGAGKSTLLKYLTLQAVDRQLPNLPHLPIHIALSDFASSPHRDLIAFAATRWDEAYGFPEDEARTFMEEHLTTGNAILLLDALDETVIGTTDERARESYSNVLEAIDRAATRYPKAPMVVTARKAGYYRRAHMNGFTELEVLDFRPEEIKEFVNNWFRYHPNPPRYATADALNEQLAQNSRMHSLAANPLLLSLIVIVYELHQDLPEKRAEIYKQCIEALLSRWDTSRDKRRRRKFKVEHKQQLLAEIAWHFHLQGRRYFPEENLLKVIATFLPTVNLLAQDSKAILSEIEEENGLLKEQAHGWHGFLHLTLQEYFVAQHLSASHDGYPHILEHCGDPWWEEVMTLYAGATPDASPLLRGLLKLETRGILWQDIFHTPLLWASQCLASKPRLVQQDQRQHITTRLFNLLKQTSYPLTREQVTKILLEIEGNDAREKLSTLLHSKKEDPRIREIVASTLGQLRDRAAIPALLSLLQDPHDNYIVRESAASALGQLGAQAAVPALLSLLQDSHNDNSFRGHVARQLMTLGQRETVLPYLRLAVNSLVDNVKNYRDIPSEFIWDYASIHTFAQLLKFDARADYVHRALWGVCQREKVRILKFEWMGRKFIRVVRQ
ncbi:MAG: hypothetical protein NVSMB44_29550 [Ktedonobacteraceae bacterium]